MRPAGIVSVIVGIGAIAQVILGHSISRSWSRGLADLHASIGVLGLALVIYLTYYSFSHSSSILLRAMSVATLLAAAVQVALGFAIYSGAADISIANAHLAGGIALALLVIATGAVSMREARARS